MLINANNFCPRCGYSPNAKDHHDKDRYSPRKIKELLVENLSESYVMSNDPEQRVRILRDIETIMEELFKMP